MSQPHHCQKLASRVSDKPVKPGSALYRLLEIVAHQVAESLAADRERNPKHTRKHND